MELLTYPKSEYLLVVSLEDLHAQSQEWLKELGFWSDEMAFFYKLLHKKDTRNVFPPKDLSEIEKALIRINSDELLLLRAAVLSHERLLSAVIKSTSMAEEQVYRETHRKLHGEMLHMNAVIRSFKNSVFSFYSGE